MLSYLKYGWTSICCAGIFLLVTQFQVANFYEAARGRVLCVFNGAMDSSSCSALLFLTIYNALGYSMTWTIYASLSALIIYRTFFLLPADAVPYLWFFNYNLKSKFSFLRQISKNIEKII